MMKRIKQGYISLTIILILSMIPLLWFKGDSVIAGGDTNQFMSVLGLVRNYSYCLTEENMGQNNLGLNSNIPSLGMFWWLFKAIKLEDHLIQRIWFVFIWFFSMWGMYLLIKEISKGKFSEIGGILGAFLYMINVFNGSLALSVSIHFIFLALPYLMLATIRAVKNPPRENRNVLYFGIIILFVGVLLLNPGYSYILFLLPVLYILYSMLFTVALKNILQKMKLIIKIFATSAILTSFFMLAYLHSARVMFGEMQTSAHAGFFGENSLQEAFRFLASWSFMASHYKIPYNPWAPLYYESFWVIFTSYLIPIMVFAGLVLQKRFKKDIFFFCLVSLLGLFLAKGVGPPLGNLYQWAFDHIPLFTAFREPWSKFTQITVFSFSILLGLSFSELKQNIYNLKLRNILIPTFAGITVCSIVIAAFPIFTSEIFSSYWNGSMKGNYIKIPDYWNKTAAYLREQESHNTVFLTPRSRLSIYEWDMGISTMASVPHLILDNPVIRYEKGSLFGGEILDLVYGLIEPESSYRFSKLLKLLGVKYLLQQNDMDWRFLPPYTYSPHIMENILSQQPELKKIKTIGELDIYEIAEESYLPEIYIPDNNSLVYGHTKDLPKLSFTDILDKKPLINFTNQKSLDSAIYNPDLYDNTVLVYDFSKKESETIVIDIPKGKYTTELAYEPLEQEKIISNFKYRKVSPNKPETSEIKFGRINFMNPEKEMPVFSVNPILANWEYDTLFYQPPEKRLVLENFNNKSINVDLYIRFKYYWKGTVKLFDMNTDKLLKEKLLVDFGDFLEIKDVLIEPGKNIFNVICIPTKCEKNWPGETVSVQRDIGIKLSNNPQPLNSKFYSNNKLILETDYNLTVFGGIKQIDLLCYLDSNNDEGVDALMQVTIDDWLMDRGISYFKVDLIEAMEERLNNSDYKILAIDMVCYPSRGGKIEKKKDRIEGEVILTNFLMTHLYYPAYTAYSRHLENNFHILNPFKDFIYADFRQISDKSCYPFIIEIKETIFPEKMAEINLPKDHLLNLKWLILIPENGPISQQAPCGRVKKIKKTNPVMYRAEAEINEPCFIVFSKRFHPEWKAFIQSKTDKNHLLNNSILFAYIKNKLQHRKEITNHIEVNGFANAWYLDSTDIEALKSNDKEIIIIFYPQIFQELGTLITLSFLIGILSYTIVLKLNLKIPKTLLSSIKGITILLLHCSNLLFFFFAYNLLRCAYYMYLANTGAEIKDPGRIIDSSAVNAFYFLILFVILKSIILRINEKKEEKERRL